MEPAQIVSFFTAFHEYLPPFIHFSEVDLVQALSGSNPSLLISLMSAVCCMLSNRDHSKPFITWEALDKVLVSLLRARQTLWAGSVAMPELTKNFSFLDLPKELKACVLANLCDFVAEECPDIHQANVRVDPTGSDGLGNMYFHMDAGTHARLCMCVFDLCACFLLIMTVPTNAVLSLVFIFFYPLSTSNSLSRQSLWFDRCHAL